jgi:hypothetical protein
MNVRRPTPRPRPQTTIPADLLSGSSTSGWYAAWKARKTAAAATPEPEPTSEGDAPDALARWLTGDNKK